MKTLERRACTRPIEVREAADGTISLHGYASVFDSEAYGEVVKPSAFNRTLAQKDDVRLLVNHDGVPLARTKSGTLSLSVDDTGLLIEAKSLDPANPTVQELRSAMARGDIDQMSFGFEALDDPMVEGVRELREVKLFDVSIVTYPWYEATSAEMNSRQLVEARSAGKAPKLAERARMEAALRGAPPGMSSYNEISDTVCDAISDRIEEQAGTEPDWLWIADIGPSWAVYSVGNGTDYFQVSWEMDDTGAVTLGDAVEVSRHTTWEPAETNSAPMTVAEARAVLGLPEAA